MGLNMFKRFNTLSGIEPHEITQKNGWGLQRGEKHKGNAAMIQSKLEHLVEHFCLGQIFVGILISNM